MSTTTPDQPTTDRQPRVRRTTGLVAALAALAVAAVAVPALAATTDPQTAASTETTVTAAEPSTTSTTAAPTTTTSTTAPAPPAPTAEELAVAQIATMTPEQQLAFDLFVASPEERAAWAAFIAPPPPPPAPAPAPAPVASGGGNPPNAFLACVRQRESGGNYGVSSADGLYRGAYQFHQNTWNNTAAHAGRGDLVGRDPASVAPADQDAMAAHLYSWQGSSPWGGYC